MAGIVQDSGIAFTQLNRLISELLRGTMSRNCFRPWEIDLLLDIEGSDLRPPARRELLRRYQKAVRRHYENDSGPPPRLSEFLEAQRTRKARHGGPAESDVEVVAKRMD